MSSRKNDMGGNAFNYIDVKEVDLDIEQLRNQIQELDKKIEDLEDEVDKLHKINTTLRNQLTAEIMGLTEL